MEGPDQLDDVVMGSHGSSSSSGPYPSVLTKRKRTKRPVAKAAAVTSSPPPLIAASSTSTSSVDVSTTAATAVDEEEDMANCLILLAQGLPHSSSSSPTPPPHVPHVEKFSSRKFTEAATTAGGKAGFYVYECKTCNRCFPSFQALGGHRASHKKPKTPALVLLPISCDDIDTAAMTIAPPPAAAASSPTGNNQKTARVHECSICGAEFSSGQALGGHMRRHRPIGPAANSNNNSAIIMQEEAAAAAAKKKKNEDEEERRRRRRSSPAAALSLDLNLPAPSDDFSFADHNKPMPALVDCHY